MHLAGVLLNCLNITKFSVLSPAKCGWSHFLGERRVCLILHYFYTQQVYILKAKKLAVIYFKAGLQKLLQPCSRAARKWRENKEMKRKWRENEEIERKWRENEEMDRE